MMTLFFYTSTVNFTIAIYCCLACYVNSVLEAWHAPQIICTEKRLCKTD